MKNGIRLIFALAFGTLCMGSLHALTSKPIGLAPTQIDSDGIANVRVTAIGGGGAASAVSVLAGVNGISVTAGLGGANSLTLNAIAGSLTYTAAQLALIYGAVSKTASVTSTFALNTTSATAVAVIGLTRTVTSTLFLNNSTAGAIQYAIYSGGVPPAFNTNGNYFTLPAGDSRLLSTQGLGLAMDTAALAYCNANLLTPTAGETH